MKNVIQNYLYPSNMMVAKRFPSKIKDFLNFFQQNNTYFSNKLKQEVNKRQK